MSNSTTPSLDGSLNTSEVINFHLQQHNTSTVFSFATEDGTLIDISRFEFARAAHRVAHFLRPERTGTVRDGDVVGIVALTDALLYQTLVAGCIVAGLVPFPISHRNSDVALSHLLHTTKAHHVLTTRASLGRLVDSLVANTAAEQPPYTVNVKEIPTLAAMYPWLGKETPSDDFVPCPAPPAAAGLDEVTLYLHSSGSTGLPKSIPFTHRVALSVALTDVLTQFGLLAPRLAVGALPSFHAMGILSQFIASVFGSVTACIYPPAALLAGTPGEYVIPTNATPENALEQARRAKADGVFTVPAFLLEWAGREEDVAYLKGLKLIAFSGGPLASKVGDYLVKLGVRLEPVYGGTEFGAGNTLIRTDEVLPGEWSWMEFSKRSSIRWVPAGDGTFECQYLSVPTHTLAVENIPDARGYSTKDVFERHPTKPNLYRIVGRLDDVLIMANGEKTVPGPMENVLNASPYIAGAVMFGRERNQIGVLVEPTPAMAGIVDPADDKQLGEFRNLIWGVVQEANELAPAFAKIYKEMILVTRPDKPMARAPKGTVIKKAVLAAYDAEIAALYETIEASGNAAVDIAPPASWAAADLEPWLATHAALLSGKPIADMEADLFEQGFDSLNATFLRHRIVGVLKAAKFDVQAQQVPQNVVYSHPSVKQLAGFVAGLVSGEDGETEKDAAQLVEEMVKKYTAGLDAPFVKRVESEGVIPNGAVVLLTGSTGGIGSHILEILLRSDAVERVYAFNRPSKTAIAQRQLSAFRDRGLEVEMLQSPRLVYIEGDSTRTDLGVSEVLLCELQSSVSVIIHNAWALDFNKSLSTFEPHIRGTRNLVDLARHSEARFLFTSSISSAQGWDQNNGPFPEELQLDANVAVGNGYGEGKYVSERILAASKLPATSFRIGQVTGSSSNGAWSTTDWVPAIVKSSIALGKFPSAPGSEVAWIQPEAVAQAIVDVALLPGGAKQPFALNLVHPQTVPWVSLFRAMAEVAKLPLVSIKEWVIDVERRATGANAEDMKSIPAIKLLDFLKVAAGSGSASLPFSTAKAQMVSKAMATLEALNEADVKRWMKYWTGVGFITI